MNEEWALPSAKNILKTEKYRQVQTDLEPKIVHQI